MLRQVKNKVAGDKKAELAIRPIGLPRNHHQPLPYLAMMMELGNESKYQDTHSKIKCEASEPPADGEFAKLYDSWKASTDKLEAHDGKEKDQKNVLEQSQKQARLAVDSCNRYLISVRGISRDVYGILQDAGIAEQFVTLFSILMPLPVDDFSTMKHMRPLERLSESDHTEWMVEYDVSNKGGDSKGKKRRREETVR
ncbi:hypothetical protein APHAL10511_003327 [Amanita phalloides]|nr:hypothetical protein APHAL10511_003327 [Amanita phalloides]